jgi:hypothetical protein
MPFAVVLMLSDDGKMTVGEVDPAAIDATDFEPVETFEAGVEVAERILLGDAPPPEVEENAFNASVKAPVKSGMTMDMEE